MGDALAPITSPLKVKEKKGTLRAEDGAGGLVVDGVIGRTAESDRVQLRTIGGFWRMPHIDYRVKAPALVYDADGQPVAEVHSHKSGLFRHSLSLTLASGEEITFARKRHGLAYGCVIDDLADARTPALAPQRYFTLTCTDQLLARPDRDLLVAMCAYLAEDTIAAAIIANQD